MYTESHNQSAAGWFYFWSTTAGRRSERTTGSLYNHRERWKSLHRNPLEVHLDPLDLPGRYGTLFYPR